MKKFIHVTLADSKDFTEAFVAVDSIGYFRPFGNSTSINIYGYHINCRESVQEIVDRINEKD